MPALPALPAPNPLVRSATSALLVSLLVVVATSHVHAAPVVGFLESFPGTSTANWASGNNASNPGSGGALGPGDGYLLVSTPGFNSNLGAFGSGPDYAGDWTAAGATTIRLLLNDVNASDPLELHLGIGNTTNFWQYNLGFIPPVGAWGAFTVDLTSAASFTRIVGTGTFADALANADRVLVRHDKAPFIMQPDPLDGDFGLDEFLISDGVVGVSPFGAAATSMVQLAAPYPNPSRGPVALSLHCPASEAIRIEIVDVTGRIVRVATLAAGAETRLWTWDGCDETGRRAAAGYYRVRAYGPAGGTSRALIRLAP